MYALKGCPQQRPLLQSPQTATCHTTCIADPPRQRPLIEPQNRPCAIVDYSKFMSGNDDDTSPPHKRHTVDLKRMPSSSRIASQKFHTKPSTTPRPIRWKESSTITKPASSEETRVAIEALLSLGNDVIPENDITAENSALVPVGINVPPSADDNPDTVNDGQDVVPNQPTPLCTTPCTCTDLAIRPRWRWFNAKQKYNWFNR